MTDGLNRRRFLKVLGVTGGGAAALSACGLGSEPQEKLIPYLIPPEDQVPGTATYYATTCRECSAGCGLHVRVREGRAVKLEGNPDSPINRGRLCARGQAALQGLYNPDRVTGPLARNAAGQLGPVSWDEALTRLTTKVREARGRGIVFLTGHEPSAFGDLVDEWMRADGGGGRRVTYEPFAFEALREGNRRAFGTTAIPAYDFESARYILSFGADFLDTWLSPVGFQQGFARSHGFQRGRGAGMAKFVFVGPRLSLTGINADEWIPAAPGTEGILALSLAQVILSRRLAPPPPPADAARLRGMLDGYAPRSVAAGIGIEPGKIETLARELAASGAPLAVAGGMAAHYANGADIVAAVNILNYVAGAVGKTVKFGADLAAGSESAGTFRETAGLTGEMDAGRVALLLVHGANPGHSLGGGYWQGWGKVGFKVSFSPYLDETAAAADLVLPDLHPLEQWNDVRPRAGVYALQQPVMQPVFPEARHAGDLVLRLLGRSGTFKDYVQTRWRELHRRFGAGKSFEQFWTDALANGGIYAEAPTRAVRLGPDADSLLTADRRLPPADGSLLLVFPHPVLHDGRGANKPWLQELPDPVSKIAWHGWVELHPDTAATWAVVTGDYVVLKSEFGAVKGPVWVTASVRPGVLAVPTGQGHTAYGRYAQDRSFNAFELLPGDPNDFGGRTFAVHVSVAKTGEHRRMATTEGNAREGGKRVVQVLGLTQAQGLRPGQHPFEHEEFPDYAERAMEDWAEAQHRKAELGDYAGEKIRWGLAIDLAKCTGCSACVTACYAENNIATVGEELLTRGREMAWLRIERYWRTDAHGAPAGAVVNPMLCQQCGNAPCEPVCPVYAAYHTPDGLNGQVYNRCVGTRYCANNCPYKVRYFNWYNFAEPGGAWEAWPEPLPMLLNPDVTVREKGVMEKCTFCVQRIRGAQNQARLEDRDVRDGEIVPACAQACPSEAIVFGNLNDRRSRVRAQSEDPRGYHVLAQLNTRPAITYLARVVHGEAAPSDHG